MEGFGGVCETHNDGDPVVLYDQLANRWLISQFAVAHRPTTSASPSRTTQRRDRHLESLRLPPRHELLRLPAPGRLARRLLHERQRVQRRRHLCRARGRSPSTAPRCSPAQPATFQTTSAALGSRRARILPADLDGSTLLPPAGAPNFFAAVRQHRLKIYQFHVDWTTPANSTFTSSASLAAPRFTQLCTGTRTCVPQPGTRPELDGIGDRLMYRLAYRNFGDHESLVVQLHRRRGRQSAGMRWFEMRNPSGAPALFQQGTYQPDTT